jgi:uncharacterized protein YbaP (TraB family)
MISGKTRLILLLFLVILYSLSLHSEQKHKHFLWEVNCDSSTVYLLGSIHVARSNIYPLSPVIENAYDSSKSLVVELNINNIDIMGFQERAVFTGGKSLKDAISPENYQKLKELFETDSIPSIVFNKFKPWFAVMTLMLMELQSGGIEGSQGIDEHFLKKDEDKRVLEFETLDDQINIFDSISDQDAFIKYSLSDMKNTVNEMDTLLTAWQNGDTLTIEQTMNDPAMQGKEMESVRKALIDDRNVRMAQKIDSYLKSKGSYFVIVGAGHLVGKKGILELLRRKGYNIKQL